MMKFDNPLLGIQIASPCKADWDSMNGDDQRRFCGECNLSVYNLSGMSKTEAENLLIESEGKVCVRLFKRSDGSIITKDCPIGFEKIRERAKLILTAAVSIVFTFIGVLGMQNLIGNEEKSIARLHLFTTPTPEKLMGEFAEPSPTPKKTASPKPTPETRILMGKPSAPKSN
jgi:hypothetical protein